MASVLISCGEPSGDLYAGALVDALRALDPGLKARGLGGERLQAAGATLVGDYRGVAVTGLIEAIRVLPRSYALYRRLVDAARTERPDVFVAIDFPDFNFRVAGAMRRLGIPVVYYVPPQVWAWRSGRMRTLRELADRILVIFPFEPEIYRSAGVPVTFVGHPLVDLASSSRSREAFLSGLGLDPRRPTLALLPGSRPNEIRQLLRTIVDALPRIGAGAPGVQFVLARAPRLADELFAPVAASPVPIAVVEDATDDVLASADAVVTASGTATVQAAIHECPMVIVYRLAPLTYALGRPFVHVDTFGMVNLVAGGRISPELIQDGFTADAVADHAIRLLTDDAIHTRAVTALRDVKAKLGGGGASHRAAQAVLDVARKR